MEGKKISDVAKEAVEKAKPIIKEVQSKVEPEIKKAEEKAKPYVEKAKPVVKKATEEAKKKAEPVMKAAKKEAKKVKTVVDSKVYEHEVIVQYSGKSFYAKDVNEKAIEDFVANGGRRDQIKDVQLYIKPEDNAAYYVINSKTTGKIDL